jgi:hypothetical protein
LDKNESRDEKKKASGQKGHDTDRRQQIHISVHEKLSRLSIEAKHFA